MQAFRSTMRATAVSREQGVTLPLRRDRRAELRLVPALSETLTEVTADAPTPTGRLRVLGREDLPATPRRQPLRRDRRAVSATITPLLFDADFAAARQERERREVAMLAEKLQAFADRLAREAG